MTGRATAGPDNEATAAGPDNEATAAGPDNEATAAGPDNEAAAAGPDNEATAGDARSGAAAREAAPEAGRRAPECVVTPYPDGPILVRGPFRLVDDHGREIELRRRTIALCRCGRSRLTPFCDGTHKSTGFEAPG